MLSDELGSLAGLTKLGSHTNKDGEIMKPQRRLVDFIVIFVHSTPFPNKITTEEGDMYVFSRPGVFTYLIRHLWLGLGWVLSIRVGIFTGLCILQSA